MIKRIAVCFLNLYQKTSSAFFPPTCRFYPSCSEYAKISFKEFSFFTALFLTLIRLIRCNPFNPGGVRYPAQDYKKIMRKKV